MIANKRKKLNKVVSDNQKKGKNNCMIKSNVLLHCSFPKKNFTLRSS